MSKRKEERYRFDASEKKIFISDRHTQNDILLIVNATDGIIIANQLDPGKGFTATYYPLPVTNADWIYSTDGYTELLLDYDTTGMSDTDELTIFIEDEQRGLKVRPYDFGTDAIERIRVANPQSLIDADFEYGLQSTKWQSIGLNRNIPSFYEFPGASLTVTDIASQGAATYSTVRVTVESGQALAVGTPISVTGTTNTLAEGLFVVSATNGTTTFDYIAKGSIASGSIYNVYSVVKEGGTYSGVPMDLSSMSGDGAGGIVTVTFGSPHGLVPGSPLLVVDTTAGTQTHEGRFFVKQVVNGTIVTYDAGQTVTSGAITTTNVSVYAINDSFFIHRPFDGGVLLGPALPIHGLEAKRQTKRYFRYQSGKGILFSTGTLFNPIFDVQNVTYSAPDITITTQIPHGLQIGATIKLYGITSANYNGTYVVNSIVSETVFKVPAGSPAPTVATGVLEAQPRVAVTKWYGASIRCGIFDDNDGMFWEYDGQELAVVRRSSTFQLAGTVAITAGSQSVTGTNTRFTEQLKVGDKIVIRGQAYIVSTITSDTVLSISPENRGVTVSGVKPTIVREVRVPQSKFNMDRIDGTDTPSGYTVDLSKMQMLGIQYSWYGAGFIDFMLRGPAGEFITVHRMKNNNVNDEAYMRSGNLPARYEVNNISAIDKLSVATGLTTTTLNLSDASRFPTPVGIATGYVMVTSNQSGTIFHELMSYTGKSGNQLTGVTTATSYSQYLSGATRTFTGVSSSQNHPAGSSVILLNTSCAPTISHWGSSVIMDGQFDIDTGYLFNYSRTGITIAGNSSETVLMFRPAPSVSNTLPGTLGQREVLNRSQINFRSLEINNVSARNLQVTAILNPTNIGAVTWSNANTFSIGGATVFQPSFAQVAASGGIVDTTTAPTDGEVLFQYLSTTTGTDTFDLTSIKEVQNSIIGGNNVYPDGPEVVVFYITNNNSQSATVDLVLRWTEAQA